MKKNIDQNRELDKQNEDFLTEEKPKSNDSKNAELTQLFNDFGLKHRYWLEIKQKQSDVLSKKCDFEKYKDAVLQKDALESQIKNLKSSFVKLQNSVDKNNNDQISSQNHKSKIVEHENKIRLKQSEHEEKIYIINRFEQSEEFQKLLQKFQSEGNNENIDSPQKLTLIDDSLLIIDQDIHNIIERVNPIEKDLKHNIKNIKEKVKGFSKDAYDTIIKHKELISYQKDVGDLEAPSCLEELKLVKIIDDDLEASIHNLLDHISANRIAEEMDQVTYNHRTRSFFDRAYKRAHSLENRIDELLKILKVDQDRIYDFRRNFTDELVKFNSFEDREIDNSIKEIEEKAKVSFQILDQTILYLENFQDQLSDFKQKFCSQGNRENVQEFTDDIAQQIQAKQKIRYWPLITAVVTTMLAKALLALDWSLVVKEWVTVILIVVFSFGYYFSRKFGIDGRQEKMKKLKDHLNSQIFKVFGHQLKHQNGNISLFNIEPKDLSEKSQISRDSSKLDLFKGALTNIEANNKTVKLNFVLIGSVFFTFLLFYLIHTFVYDSKIQYLVTSRDNGQSCVLVEGRIVYSTNSTFYVSEQKTFWKYTLFPEFGADAIPRTIVTAVLSDKGQLVSCGEEFVQKNAISMQQPIQLEVQGLAEKFRISGSKKIALELNPSEELRKFAKNLKLGITSTHINTVYVPHSDTNDSIDQLHMLNFVNQIQVDGESIRIPDTNSNSMLLPLFTREVKDFDSSLSEEEAAYLHGSRSFIFEKDKSISDTKNEKNRKFVERNREMLEQSFMPIIKCFESPAKGQEVIIDIMAFASDPWEKHSKAKDVLNHALAEGRRKAVITAIVNYLNKPNKKLFGDIKVKTLKGDKNIIKISKELSYTKKASHRFKDFSELKNQRDDWVGFSATNDEKNPVHEVLAKSAVIKIVNTEKSNCSLQNRR